MLILSRGVGEKIFIGEGPGRITIVVQRIRDDEVRLGIDALREIPIVRCNAQNTKPRKREE